MNYLADRYFERKRLGSDSWFTGPKFDLLGDLLGNVLRSFLIAIFTFRNLKS